MATPFYTLSWLDYLWLSDRLGAHEFNYATRCSRVIGPRVISNRSTSASSSNENSISARLPSVQKRPVPVGVQPPRGFKKKSTNWRAIDSKYRDILLKNWVLCVSQNYFSTSDIFLVTKGILYWAPIVRTVFKARQPWSTLTQRQLKKCMNFSKCLKRRGLVLREWRN